MLMYAIVIFWIITYMKVDPKLTMDIYYVRTNRIHKLSHKQRKGNAREKKN